ncbi:MAG TPA: hypothetical protein VKE40_03050 [Gemmataceae bacterium]|nr:hypothetical protein [Gemmataceae bacterium]
MKRALVATLALFLSAQVGAAGPSKADLAVQARFILAKYCKDCHGEQPTRSTLPVLDHGKLTGAHEPVRFIDPNPMGMSQALDLIEEGSMPPAGRAKVSAGELTTLKDWVAAGATEYPIRFDDDFVYKSILADVVKTPSARVPMARYLSLHHLAEKPDVLARKRAEFLNAELPSLLVPGAPAAQALDPTETVFRIDLDRAGWNIQPFKEIKNGMAGNRIDANLFDVVLLEYPHAVIPAKSESFNRLVTTFLQPTRQVRPVVFVRGDWFVATAGSGPLADDLSELFKLHKRVPAGLIKPRVAAEATSPSAAPGEDIRIPALDARYGPDPPDGKGAVEDFAVDTRNRAGMKQSAFRPGDNFKLRFEAKDKNYYGQFVYVNTDRLVENVTPVQPQNGGKAQTVTLPDGGPLADDPGDESVTMFVAPHKFPQGVIWGATDVSSRRIQRFVHPFFELVKKGDTYVVDTQDARVSRRSVKIRIEKKDD